jgi:hypothetical protein
VDNFVAGLVVGLIIGGYLVFLVMKGELKIALWEAQNERNLRIAAEQPSPIPRKTAAEIVQNKPVTVRRTLRSSWIDTKAKLENQPDKEAERADRVARHIEGA